MRRVALNERWWRRQEGWCQTPCQQPLKNTSRRRVASRTVLLLCHTVTPISNTPPICSRPSRVTRAEQLVEIPQYREPRYDFTYIEVCLGETTSFNAPTQLQQCSGTWNHKCFASQVFKSWRLRAPMHLHLTRTARHTLLRTKKKLNAFTFGRRPSFASLFF